jgi:hypothetical protein
MAKSTAPMLLTTGISFGNQWLGKGYLNLTQQRPLVRVISPARGDSGVSHHNAQARN